MTPEQLQKSKLPDFLWLLVFPSEHFFCILYVLVGYLDITSQHSSLLFLHVKVAFFLVLIMLLKVLDPADGGVVKLI